LNSEIAIQGYNIIQQDRDRFGGGLAVYILESMTYRQIDIDFNDSVQLDANFEAIWIEPKPKQLKLGLFTDHRVQIPRFLRRT
jgi:hypothetical protein